MKKIYIKPECGLHQFSDTVSTAAASQPVTQDTNIAEAKQWLSDKNLSEDMILDLF